MPTFVFIKNSVEGYKMKNKQNNYHDFYPHSHTKLNKERRVLRLCHPYGPCFF